MSLGRGACCLLLGANGAGKTTLLKILGGKHLTAAGSVSVLGRDAFRDTSLTCGGDLSYIGGNWQRDIAFAGATTLHQVFACFRHRWHQGWRPRLLRSATAYGTVLND